jgi:hypothetical protein
MHAWIGVKFYALNSLSSLFKFYLNRLGFLSLLGSGNHMLFNFYLNNLNVPFLGL